MTELGTSDKSVIKFDGKAIGSPSMTMLYPILCYMRCVINGLYFNRFSTLLIVSVSDKNKYNNTIFYLGLWESGL